MLVIRVDAIGDYVLTRNFFKTLHESVRYKDYSLTLILNATVKDMAEHYDGDCFDNFISIDRKKFHHNPFYRYGILKSVYENGYAICVNPMYSREKLYGDLIAAISNAPERIGGAGCIVPEDKFQDVLDNSMYTRLIPVSANKMFEFSRNKEFFEKFLEKDSGLTAPELPVAQSSVFKGKYFLIATGAQKEFRRWSKENFTGLVKDLLSYSDLEIVLAGSNQDKDTATHILNAANSTRVHNFCGKTLLPEYVNLIGNAVLVISNDTAAVHIAAACKVPFVCISNGNHLGRFSPYPKDIFPNCKTIYPPIIQRELGRRTALPEQYFFGSSLNIQDIQEKDVLDLAKSLLSGE
jgi:ADP-heptose:LPS heptosyltransferase